MEKKVLVVGSLNMDMVTRMKQMPAEGETVLGNELTYIPGGKGANQACAAACLGADVTMLGCVGQDDFGKILRNELKSRGVKTEYLKTPLTYNTGTAIIYVNNEGNNSIVVIRGANLECDLVYLRNQDEQIRECDYILLQMEIPYESIYYIVRRAKQLGKTVILNPAPAPDGIPDEVLKEIDYLTPNETELAKLTGSVGNDLASLQMAAGMLIQKGVRHVIVTLGEKGAFYADRNGSSLYPVRKVNAVDTTAAGDCFNGALITALAEGRTDGEAICFANMVSSIAVTRMGALSSIPMRDEVDELMTL